MNRLTVLVACGILLLLGGASNAGNWPAWRGADGRGISPDTNLPVEFGPTTNLTWKTPLAGEGNSTPIIWNNRVFVTGPRDSGKIRSLRDGEHRCSELGDLVRDELLARAK